MESETLLFSGLNFTSVIVVSLLLLMALCLLQAPLSTEYPRVPFWGLFCSRCTPSLCRMKFLLTVATFTSMPMILSFRKVHHLMNLIMIIILDICIAHEQKSAQHAMYKTTTTTKMIMEIYAAPKLSKYMTELGAYNVKSFTHKINPVSYTHLTLPTTILV